MSMFFNCVRLFYWRVFLFCCITLCILISISCAQAAVLEHIVFEWPNPYNINHPGRIELLREQGYSKRHRIIKNKYVSIPISNGMILSGKVKVVSIDKYKIDGSRKNNEYEPVTGLFIHQVKSVKTWRFVDEHHHAITLNATDNHPFYVKNLHAFLPIKDISSKMLLDAGSHTLHLLCHDVLHCGKDFHSIKPVYVYNIEVGNRHVYRVGSEGVLVHNCAVTAGGNRKKVTFSQENFRRHEVVDKENNWGWVTEAESLPEIRADSNMDGNRRIMVTMGASPL